MMQNEDPNLVKIREAWLAAAREAEKRRKAMENANRDKFTAHLCSVIHSNGGKITYTLNSKEGEWCPSEDLIRWAKALDILIESDYDDDGEISLLQFSVTIPKTFTSITL